MASGNLTLAKSITPSPPDSGESLRYVDQNGVWHSLDANGVDTVLSGHQAFNWLGNSGFWFAQRQAPGTATTYSNTTTRTITADRWAIVNETASVQYQRTDTSSAPEAGLQSRYYGRFTKITNAGKFVISQIMAGLDTTEFGGRTVRFQVKLKNLTTTDVKNWRIGLVVITSNGVINSSPVPFISDWSLSGVDPILGSNAAYVPPRRDTYGENCSLNATGATCPLTTNWQRFGAIFDIPMDCQNVLVMIWNYDTVAANDGIAVAEASLTLGSEPRDWAPYNYGTELARVQRYYTKTFGIDVAPAQNVGVNTGHLDHIAGKAGATALGAQFSWSLPVVMFPPGGTVTTFNPAAASAQVRDIGAGANCTATAATAGIRRVRVTATGAAGTAIGNQVGIHLTVDSEII